MPDSNGNHLSEERIISAMEFMATAIMEQRGLKAYDIKVFKDGVQINQTKQSSRCGSACRCAK